jgi:hypothetical protein
MVRVATSTFVVIGIQMTIPLIVGIGVWAGENDSRGAFFIAIAPLAFWYFCFQTIEIANDTMTYRRPLFPPRSVSLSGITEVRTVWNRSYRRFVFMNGETVLCAFNPKLFSLEDLALVLATVRGFSPGVVFDEDTAAFLPSNADKGSILA